MIAGELANYFRVMGYFLLVLLLFNVIPFMRQLWYVPAVLGLWFLTSGMALLLMIVGFREVYLFIGAYILTPLLWLCCAALTRALWVVARRPH